VSLLDVFGSILVCLKYRESAETGVKFWLEVLVACTLLQFGGTTLTGLLLGQTPSWIISHTAFPALFIAWWLTFYSPNDIYYKLIRKTGLFGKSVLFLVGIGASISSGHAATSWGMDKALFNTFHVNYARIASSFLTCMLSGTFAACGGGILGEFYGFYRSKNAFTLSITPELFTGSSPAASVETESPTSATRSSLLKAFICALIYYTLLNPTGYLPWKQFSVSKELGHLIICSLLVFHYFSVEFLGINIFKYIGKFMLLLLNISPSLSFGKT
jgi:hypothetical protein